MSLRAQTTWVWACLFGIKRNYFPHSILHMVVISLFWTGCCWIVDECGLTSHSAILQLYSDGTDVQFPNTAGHPRHGQLGVFSVPSLPQHGHRDVRRRLLPPCHQRAHTRWTGWLQLYPICFCDVGFFSESNALKAIDGYISFHYYDFALLFLPKGKPSSRKYFKQ